ncbi:MAG: hypothetical protein EOP10_06580 [Proteobacteria bacterium]|nr:MAG: hypothetical protein EOP10_06580 [Pseudomonadota bacterium]
MEIRREPVFETESRRGAPTLAEFAKNSQISEDKVWELIEDGQVSARFVNDSILIMQDQPQFDRMLPVEGPKTEPEFSIDSRPLPDISASAPSEEIEHPHDFTEDNHDILAFAQDALSRNAELSKELLATKDELLRLKDERISFLSELLTQKDKEIRSLNRSLEEFATLKKFELR